MKIGIPRALLYHRYEVLWTTYFQELGFETIVSPVTNKTILEDGDRYAIDENCLSSKLFFGHVSALIGKCDYIFVPRIANFGHEGVLCSRFEALYDIAVNTFRQKGTEFITCDIDVEQKKSELDAYASLALQFGKTITEGARAYEAAKEAAKAVQQKKIAAQEALLEKDGIKILVVGHSYNLHDAYIGMPIVQGLKKLDAIPLLADSTDLDLVRHRYTNICKSVPWTVNRELIGAIDLYRDVVDGIILITAFPCGPDSMMNEMIIRRVTDKPILNLLLDSQDGNAGIETRLESFVDIIRFRKEAQI